MYKRYLVFMGSNYYPSGGMNDLRTSFDDKGEAIRYAKKRLSIDTYGGDDWAHIYDMETEKITRHRDHWFDYKGE